VNLDAARGDSIGSFLDPIAQALPGVGTGLPQEAAMDGVREASRSHASDSPSPGEYTNSPVIGEQQG